MYPHTEGSSGGIVILCFSDGAEHPVYLKGFVPYPLVRDGLPDFQNRGSYHALSQSQEDFSSLFGIWRQDDHVSSIGALKRRLVRCVVFVIGYLD